MIVVVDRDLCIGAAPCVAVAGNVFQLDEEGKAIVVGPSTDDNNTTLAAEACPTRAIFLYSDDHKQLFPLEKDSPRPFQEADLTNNPSAPAASSSPSTPAA